MHIMAAGVHNARDRRRAGMTCLFFHRQSVHVGSKGNASPFRGTMENTHHTVSADSGDHINPCLPQNCCYEVRSHSFLVAQFGLTVYPASEFKNFVKITGNKRFQVLIHYISS
jgi:hypothetical protein